MLTVTRSAAKSHRANDPRLAELKAACQRHGITQDRIAAVAGVTRPLVVNIFAARTKSARVVAVALGLVAEAKAALKLARARKRAANGGVE
jgi:transcriptional regulator with XRE-family HTH domain